MTTPADIRSIAYGITIPDGTEVNRSIQALIDKAENLLESELPFLSAWVADGRIADATVSGVVQDMVLRVMKNPHAWRQVSIDDGSATIDTSTSSGLLYLSAAERARLTPASRRRGRVGSVRLNLPTHRLP